MYGADVLMNHLGVDSPMDIIKKNDDIGAPQPGQEKVFVCVCVCVCERERVCLCFPYQLTGFFIILARLAVISNLILSKEYRTVCSNV